MEVVLYKIDSTGKTRVWHIQVSETPEGFGQIDMYSGTKGFRMAHNQLILKEGKNIGKKNETTPLVQATLEAESRVRKQIRLTYRYTEEEAADAKLASRRPMNAHKFQERGHDLPDEVVVLPKLNGVRMLNVGTSSGIVQISKGNTELNIQHIKEAIATVIRPGEEIDGEIFLRGLSLNLISGAIKKHKPITTSLEFHIFDVPSIGDMDATYPFIYRYEALIERMKELGDAVSPLLKIVPYDLVRKDSFKPYFDKYVADGYEGVMLRDPLGEYLYGERSVTLQKYKEADTAEYEIVRVWFDKTGLIMFTCCLPTDRNVTFDVTPLGSDEERREMAEAGEAYYIGKALTVKFYSILDSGIPEFGKGEAVRDYE